MKNAITEVWGGLKSLLIGMRITIREFFRPTVTVHYPWQTLKIPPKFRGHIELVRDPKTGRAVCFACKLCERACPSDCITVEGVKREGEKKRSVSHYVLDFTKCSLCGSCVEACRDGAIRFSRDYNLAGLSKEEFVMDLFKRLEDEACSSGETGATPVPLSPATPPATDAPAKPAAPKPELPPLVLKEQNPAPNTEAVVEKTASDKVKVEPK
jgi:NADH-quinone oxidoreductase subunit I